MRRLALLALLPLLAPAAEQRHLRYDNIHDAEVTEIQRVMSRLAPGAIVDIDSVYDSCSCEEGITCSAQVWVVSHRSGRSTGIWLSKMDGHWTLGPYEQWQSDINHLYWRRTELIGPRDAPDFASRRDTYNKQMLALQTAKPHCGYAPAADSASR